MRLELKKKPFETNIVELIEVIDCEDKYSVEVYINYGFSLEETEIEEIVVLEHGLSEDKLDEIIRFVEEQFKNVQYNRQLCK